MRAKPSIFFGFAAGLAAAIVLTGTGSVEAIKEGANAPEFSVKTDLNDSVKLSDFKGSLVFVNFWAVDCLPCEAEMPDMNALAEIFKGRKFQMMPINLDIDLEPVTAFYGRNRLTMPLYRDPGRRASSDYNVLGTPETFLIGPDGIIRKYFVGQQAWTSPKMIALLNDLIPN
jgi:cytochrome c biogenesis protein CcmG, thiol:disulfide interchange protein DsbE